MNAIDETAGGRDGSNLRNPMTSGRLQGEDDRDVRSNLEVFTSAAQQLRADLKKSRPFADGTIVRWTSVAVNGSRFHYAAIYANGHWFTTSQRDTEHIQKKMRHEEFLDYLHTHGYSVTSLAVAVDFEVIEL